MLDLNSTSLLLKALGRYNISFPDTIPAICDLKPSLLITILSDFLYILFSRYFNMGKMCFIFSFSTSLTLSGQRSLTSNILSVDWSFFWKKKEDHGMNILGVVTYIASYSFW